MTPSDDDRWPRPEICRSLRRRAGERRVARKRFLERPRSQRPDFKGPQDFLTATDAEVEELIRTRLSGLFPQDSFFGEEGGGSFERDVWVVDPSTARPISPAASRISPSPSPSCATAAWRSAWSTT